MAASLPVCGIVMPISTKTGNGSAHWEEMLTLYLEVTSAAQFEPLLVSSAAQVGLVQQRIVRNLYRSPMVICDVSGKHPHVMFELGMRLAFDRPTIIVKDDQTDYSFTNCPVEHLEYPYDLTDPALNIFRRELGEKLEIFRRRADRGRATSFLEYFGAGRLREVAPEPPATTASEVPRDLQVTREALQKFSRSRITVPATPVPRPIVELQGWKSCDVQSFISGVAPTVAKDIVVTKSDCGRAHYLLLPADFPAVSFVRDLGFFSGTDSVRLLR